MRYPSVSAQVDALVVTRTPLLASVIATEYARAQIASGALSWDTPKVVTIYAWLAQLWQEHRHQGRSVPTLLSSSQEQLLWERLFQAEMPELFDHCAAARLAVEATRSIGEWQLPLEHEAWHEYADAVQFRRLWVRFRRECERRNAITRSDLWRFAPAWLQAQKLPVQFAGFLTRSPGLAELLGALKPRGSLVQEVVLKARRMPKAHQFESEASGLEHVARWARNRLEANPRCSIGVLVPNLASQRLKIRNTFLSVFRPNLETGHMDVMRIEGGENAKSEPLIACACLLLELAMAGSLSVTEASALIRSPFLPGADAERNMRALADLRLRARRDIRVTLSQIERSTSSCPNLVPIWRKLAAAKSPSPSMNLADWSDWINQLLFDHLEWPGTAELSIHEQLVLEHWNQALTDLSALSFVSSSMPWPQAYAHLRSILSGVDNSDWFAPIQVLDADSASGLRFDYVALVGFDEANWPRPERSQPFLPVRLRRQAGMPESSAKGLTEMRHHRSLQLLGAADEVVVTFCGSLNSLFLPHVNVSRQAMPGWNGNLARQAFAPAELERLVDECGPPLKAGAAPSGGVSILKAQSACPFQAFARFRLAAETPEEACFGLDARERGGFVHKALENVWQQLRDSERLSNADPETLQQMIRDAVQQTVAENERSAFQMAVSETERARLVSVLSEWLSLEKTRLHPFAVEHTEEKLAATINGLPLGVRIDRIDRLRDGSVLLIDYKTGTPSAKQLMGDRPEEPQLLIYAEAIDAQVAGVYFGQVRAREMKADGLALTPHFPSSSRSRPKEAPSWIQERAKSTAALKTIAGEFVAGWASVSPRKGACTFCGLDGLCRVAESGSVGEDEADE